MALDLPYFRPGAKFREELTAERLNKMVAAIRSLEIQPGTNVRVSRTPGGTTLKASIPKHRGGSAGSCPFNVSLELNEANYKIKVTPGTVNGVYATNYIASMIFDTTTLSVGQTANTNVVLNITTDGKQVTAYEIGTAASVSVVSPTTPLAPTSVTWPIAYIASGKVYRTIGCNSLSAVVRESVRVVKTPATPGDNAYDIYYYWDVQSA